MRVAIGADHAGYELKEAVARLVEGMGHEVHDFGPSRPESVDYPDFARKVARGVSQGRFDRGILICGTGIGMCITANKVPGIRAALCHDHLTARLSREHNDANVLCLGGRLIGPALAAEIVETWLQTAFQGGRHARRLDKIRALEDPAEKSCP